MSEDFNRLHASRKYLGKCTMSQKDQCMAALDIRMY